ncbi:MAG: hypothetical protein WD929_09575 [Steroidobacteraceae bacterium]
MIAQCAAPRAGGLEDSGFDQGSERSLLRVQTAGKQKPESKIARVLAALIAGPKSTRELELPPTCDHVGHSTASDLRRLGISLEAERIEIRGFGGAPCWIARYRIRDEGLAFAREVLARMRERRARGGR